MSETDRRAWGYTRVSTEEQVKGVSLDAQAEQIRRYCELYSLDLSEVLIDEGRSGKDMERPALRELMDRAGEGEVSAVVVYRLDRISRDTVDSLLIQRRFIDLDVKLCSTTEELGTGTADDEFRFTINAAVSQLERKKIAERTKMALDHKRERGEWLGAVPFGWRREGYRLALDLDQQKTIEKMRRMRRQGKSERAIAVRLDVPKSTVHRLLTDNPRARKAKYSKAM